MPNGRYSGAFTEGFEKTMPATRNKLSRKAVVEMVRAELKGKFSQAPQLLGTASGRQTAFAT